MGAKQHRKQDRLIKRIERETAQSYVQVRQFKRLNDWLNKQKIIEVYITPWFFGGDYNKPYEPIVSAYLLTTITNYLNKESK